jgi:RNA polymerase sigma factor (sigma-70 family)
MFFSKKKSPADDSEIIAAYKISRDKQLIGELFLRYSHLVYGIVYKYFNDPDESKDAVMEIFELLDTLLLKYEVKNFKTWLYSVAKNHCLLILRSKKTDMTEFYPEDEKIYMENSEIFHLSDTEDKEFNLVQLENSVDLLEEPQRTCIKLFYLENKSYKEIYDLTGMSFNKVKSCIQNGKRNLKLMLERKGIGSRE